MSQATLLDGIVVLDTTQVMAGPYCAMLLADMGARVIKVEPPAGDSTRSMAGARGNDSPAFNAVNRGKLGIVLDLNHRAGPQRLQAARPLRRHPRRKLSARRDGDASGSITKRCSGENPRLIYASISGHGQTGPWAAKGGFDLIAQGLSGLMSVTGNADERTGQGRRADHRSRRGAVCADRHPRARCTIARQTGAGQHIDTSLVDAGLALSVWEVDGVLHDRPGAGAAWLGASPDRAVSGLSLRRRLHHDRRRQRSQLHQAGARARPPRVARPTRGSRRITQRIAHREELAATDRSGHRRSSRSRSGSSELEQAGVPCGPILDYEDALTTPQAIAREMTVDVEHPTLGTLRTLGTPIKMSATPLNPKRRGPMLGEHTDDVLARSRLQQRRDRAAALHAARSADARPSRYWTPRAFEMDHNVVITVFAACFRTFIS